MKLYDTARAPNPRRVRIFLAEKGIVVPMEQVDLGKLEQWSETFTAINPLQQTPSLILDDGTIIAESLAICRYFEELQPKPALFGEGALGKANVEMWQRRVELHFFSRVLNVFRHGHPKMAEREKPQIPAFAEANRPKALGFLGLLDGELANRPFIAGDDFSVADITALAGVDFMKPAGLAMPEDLPHLAQWYARVSSRPSAVP
jgi:glutathione S-transferase